MADFRERRARKWNTFSSENLLFSMLVISNDGAAFLIGGGFRR